MFSRQRTHIQSLPHAILHIDGDSFFASCEQALNASYQGKPVVIGRERGIATAMSIEAKECGVTRGMLVSEVKRICSEAIILSGSFETYALFSKRMFEIFRRYSDLVEEGGIDEGFIDITGLRRAHNKSYQLIAEDIQHAVERELGISVSIGIAPTKTLAKIASSRHKPHGLTTILGRHIKAYLHTVDIGEVWGVGRHTTNYMRQLGIHTAHDFISKDFDWVKEHFTKPHQTLWRELNGEMVYSVLPEKKEQKQLSISKTRTFSAPSKDREVVYAHLLKNLERACRKARKHKLVSKHISIMLKKQDFSVMKINACLNRASAYPTDMTMNIKIMFDQLFEEGNEYRSAGVFLGGLGEQTQLQQSLFEAPVVIDKLERVYDAVDTIETKYGRGLVRLGTTMRADSTYAALEKNSNTVGVENKRRHLKVPMLLGLARS